MEFPKIGFRYLSSNDCQKGSVFAKGELCLLLGSQKIHFFHLLGDFWDKSKGVSKVFELTLFAEIVLLIASKSSEKSKCFFLGQLRNLSGIFFLDQRSTVREIENLKKLIRPSPGVLDPRSNKNPGCL